MLFLLAQYLPVQINALLEKGATKTKRTFLNHLQYNNHHDVNLRSNHRWSI